MAKANGFLFVGGSAHGKWIAVQDREHTVKVARPVTPSLWAQVDSEFPNYAVEEETYVRVPFNLFGWEATVFVLHGLYDHEKRMAILQLLLSEDGRQVVGL